MTAYNALFNKGKVEKGMNVLISGVGGGVAQLRIFICACSWSNVYVTSRKMKVTAVSQNIGAKGGAN